MPVDLERLLRSVTDRVARFRSGTDTTGVIDRESDREIGQLLAVAAQVEELSEDPRQFPSLQISIMVGWLLWCRSLLPGGMEEWREPALGMLDQVFIAEPWSVPSEAYEDLFHRCLEKEGPHPADIWGSQVPYLRSVYERTGDPEALTRAIGLAESSFHSAPSEDAHSADRAEAYADVILVRFFRWKDTEDVSTAVEMWREALRRTPMESIDQERRLTLLCIALRAEAKATGSVAGLDEAMERLEELKHQAGEAAARLLGLRSLICMTRYQLSHRATDLVAATNYARDALDHFGTAAPLMYSIQYAECLDLTFKRTRELGPLNQAIDVLRRALQSHAGPDKELEPLLDRLDMFIREHHQAAGSMPDLDLVMEAAAPRQRLEAERVSRVVDAVQSASVELVQEFGRTGDREYLDRAISGSGQALADLPVNMPLHGTVVVDTHSMSRGYSKGRVQLTLLLMNLLSLRYDTYGDLADADACIELGETERDTVIEYSDLALLLANVAHVYMLRGARLGSLSDAAHAVDRVSEAVALAPDGEAMELSLAEAGAVMRRAFELTRDVTVLDRSIQFLRRAAQIASSDHLRGRNWNNLSLSLRLRYEHAQMLADQRTGPSADVGDLQEAVHWARESLEQAQTSEGLLMDQQRVRSMTSLASALFMQYKATRDDDAAEEAIRLLGEAIDITSADDAARPERLSNLANFIRQRCEISGNDYGLVRAVQAFREAAQCQGGSWLARARGALGWGVLASATGDQQDALKGFTAAVELLRQLAWQGLPWDVREHGLAEMGWLTTEAAAHAVAAGQPDLALELLERGRSVLWARDRELQVDLGRLRSIDESLAAQLETIRAALLSPEAEHMHWVSGPSFVRIHQNRPESAAQAHRRLVWEWERLIAEARHLHGEGSLFPSPSIEELKSASHEAPVVVVNVSSFRCDALLVRDGTTSHLELTKLTKEMAGRAAERLLLASHAVESSGGSITSRIHLIETLEEVLDWLWGSTCQPVLDALGFTRTVVEGEVWPRVYWCPTGPLTLLPLHAAAPYMTSRAPTGGDEPGSDAGVLDRVVSSYTTTLGMLRRRRPARSSGIPRVLAVVENEPPGVAGLLPISTSEEITEIATEVRITTRLEKGSPAGEPTVKAVLSALDEHSWIHFACHAMASLRSPGDSAFLLADGNLTVRQLGNRPATDSRLAYLSACSTSVGGVSLLDESIHLAASVQSTGFAHVIASLWAVDDRTAPKFAKTLYHELAGDDRADEGAAAYALHCSVADLRTDYLHRPDIWATFVHFGTFPSEPLVADRRAGASSVFAAGSSAESTSADG
jgi:tetratricopeptide (TPR) repeat protein